MKNKISTLIGIVVILIAAVIMFSGVFAYQYHAIKLVTQFPVQKNGPAVSRKNTAPSNDLCNYFSGNKGVTTNYLGINPPSQYNQDPLLPLTCYFVISPKIGDYTFKFSKTTDQYNSVTYHITIFDSSNKLVQFLTHPDQSNWLRHVPTPLRC